MELPSHIVDLDSYMEGSAPHASLAVPREQGRVDVDPLDFLADFDLRASTPRPRDDLILSVEQQKIKMQSVVEIFTLEEEQPRPDEDMDVAGGEEAEHIEERKRRTQRLKGALPLLAQLWWADSAEMDVVAEKLGDGSRDPKWRLPLGDSGVLNFFLEIMSAHTLRHTLKIHVLRLVGNSCADTDENRARVVASDYLPSIINQLRDVDLVPFAIPVLYNICVDYEPAQQQASDYFLTKELIELMGSPAFNNYRSFLTYSCKILDLMISRESEPEHAPENTPIVLLRISADRENPVDMDDYIACTNTAVAYLQHEKFQIPLVVQGALVAVIHTMVNSYTRFDAHPTIGSSDPNQEEEEKALSTMRSNLNQVLSDISALPQFKEAYPVHSTMTSTLRRWLLSPQSQLQVCGCIMLGNLARSDEACVEFVRTSRIYLPLITILKDANDSQLLHAALGFFKNLAIPVSNKEELGGSGIFDVLPRLWQLDTLQPIQFASISLARQLTIGTFENVRKVCQRLSKDEDSPAHNRTNLSILIALFERTDVQPIKMEISRLITSVCRVFNTYTGRTPEDMERIRIKFFKLHPDVGRPLSFMVSQTTWPVVRSEGWFVFALMARFPEGAQCISDLMQDVAVFQPLVEMLTGKSITDASPPLSSPSSATLSSPTSPPALSSSSASAHAPDTSTTSLSLFEPQTQSPQPHAQAAEMARLDRENALVLVSELLKNRGSQMAVMRRTLFEELLKGGGELVLSYKEASPNFQGRVLPRDQRVRAGLNLQEVAQQSFNEIG